MKRGNQPIIAILMLIAAALTGSAASAGELQTLSTPDLCGRDRNYAYRMFDMLSEQLDMIERTTLSYRNDLENNAAASEYWKKRKGSPIERALFGPDSQESIDQKIMIADGLASQSAKKMTHYADRALKTRQQITTLEKALNADECPWAAKKQRQRHASEFIANTASTADHAQSESTRVVTPVRASRAQ